MNKNLTGIPDFDDIVFEIRNKDYGAFILRKEYKGNVIKSLLIGITLFTAAIITPFININALRNSLKPGERLVEIRMENLNEPNEIFVPPPPPPPPPAGVAQQVRYIPPVVVDSVRPGEEVKLMTSDQAKDEIKNDDVELKEEVKKEVITEDSQPEPFLNVEEMPVPSGGEAGLLKFIAENTHYPEEARENNVEGTVIVKFCVTSTGSIDMVSILKSVDPELDTEAIRVVKSLPPFKPGKHQGRAVPVWYIAPIKFTLQ